MIPAPDSNQITLLQYIIFINELQTGVGILSLPRLLAKSAGTDGWISLLLGYAIAVATSLIIIQVMKRHPDKTMIGIVLHYFGNITGKGFSVLIALYMIIFAYNVLEETALIMKSRLLQQTPIYVILGLFVIPAFVLATGGIRILARYAIAVKFIAAPFFYLLILSTLRDANWIYLLPILKEGWNPIFEGVKTTVFSFLGFESAFFLYPYLQNKKHASIGIIVANTLTLIACLFVTILCSVFFSPDQITKYNHPTLDILKIIEFRFAERLDVLMLAAYSFVISTTYIPYLFFGSTAISQLFRKEDVKTSLKIILSILVFVPFFHSPSWTWHEQFTKMMSNTGLLMAFLLPVGLWAYTFLYHRLHRRRER